jgi:hypothetical protein
MISSEEKGINVLVPKENGALQTYYPKSQFIFQQ